MSEQQSKATEEFFSAGALVGMPVEDAGMSRSQVDGLDFSTERSKRPANMSREDYIESRPGRQTKLFLREAGIERRRVGSRALLGAAVILTVAIVATVMLLG